MSRDLTDDEAKAIASLERLAKRWPKTLRLVSMSGDLAVVHTKDDRFLSDDSLERQEAVLADIRGIPNTGGDW